MDPNETLRQIRELLHSARKESNPDKWADYAEQVMQDTQALDDWLSRGGFLPESWKVSTSLTGLDANGERRK